MASESERPEFWPFVSGGLTADVLRPFAPLGFGAVSDAHRLEILKDVELRRLIRDGLLCHETPMLALFLDTASTFDRRRDISEELARLALGDSSGTAPLWMILGRIILQEYSDTDAAVQTLEDLYGWSDYPVELRPFTLYAGIHEEGRSTTASSVRGLDALLRARGI
jgi:hypothetical protein